MVKTRHKGEPDHFVEEEAVNLGKRRTRSAPVLPDQINGFISEESADDDSEVVLQQKPQSPARSPSAGRRSTRRSAPLAKDEMNDEEDEPETHFISPRHTRRRVKIQVEEPEGDDEDDEEEEEERRPKQSRGRGSRQSRRSQEHEDDDDGEPRRSSRNRKYLYATFKESLMDKRMVLVEEEPRSRRSSRRGASHIDDHEEPPIKRRRTRSREALGSDVEDDGQDMYTRVKRVRPQVKRDMYGMPVTEEEKDEEDEEGGSSGSSESESEEEEGPRKYSLREHRTRTNIYMAPTSEPRPKPRSIFHSHSPPRTRTRPHNAEETYNSPARRKRPVNRRRRPSQRKLHGHSSTSSSGSSGGDSGDDEDRFQRRKAKSMMRARNNMLPMNFAKEDIAAGAIRDRTKIGSSLADVDPMNLDRSVTFDQVGGLGKHVQKLKEMVVFPLLYPEVFDRFKIAPPRGVLFYGPPGTGKTLVARALANECSTNDRKVAFFMRKGADCLSKWVGESERQLRLLFDQAYQMRPSIIFFDEIDGLAPVRSSRQDQIHSSIVSTLLALMDGLDNRGEIVVIGATNRIDSIDPALRRPGRFDREFLFPLPSLEARKQILQIHTTEWVPKLRLSFLSEVAERCVGYCGADLRAVCTEAALFALRRRYPQIYTSKDKLELDVKSIEVSAKDFFKAMSTIVPTSQRSQSSAGRPLNPMIRPLLQGLLQLALSSLQQSFPSVLSELASNDLPSAKSGADDDKQLPMELYSDDDDDAPCIFEAKTARQKKRYEVEEDEHRSFLDFNTFSQHCPLTHRPRMLVCGQKGQGQTTHLAPAIIHAMERVPVHVLDLPALFGVSAKSPEEACAHVFREARRTAPSIIYMPHIGKWWDVLNDTLRATFETLLEDLQSTAPMLLLATSDAPLLALPEEIRNLFDTMTNEVVRMSNPTEEERHEFFQDLLLRQVKKPPPQRRKAALRLLEELPKAQPAAPRELTESELKRIRHHEASTMRELRIFLRDVLNKLGRDRKFGIFSKPVDLEEVPDYHTIIAKPMDLSTMMSKLDLHKYQSVKEFTTDIELICCNALEYNPDTDPQGRAIRHRACALRDTCQAIITNELDQDFEKLCEEIATARNRRGDSPSKDIPSYYHTRPLNQTIGQSLEEPSPVYSKRVKTRRTRGLILPSDDEMQMEAQCNGDGPPKLRQVYKRVPIPHPKAKSSQSPWCRPTKRRYKKVLVWIDEYGREVKPEHSDDSDKDTEHEQEEVEDNKDTCDNNEQPGSKASPEKGSPSKGSPTKVKDSPDKTQKNGSAEAEEKDEENDEENEDEKGAEFPLASRRRTRSCLDLNGDAATTSTEALTSPKSRSAGASPAAVSNPPRMHSPRRVSAGAANPHTPSKAPPEVTKSPRRLASPSKSPHNSPVAKVLPMEVVVNGSGDAAKKEEVKEGEEAMETEEKAAVKEPAAADEDKKEEEENKEEKTEKKDSPPSVRVTRSAITSSAQRDAALAVLQEPVPDIVVDEDHLRYLLNKIVTATNGYTVEKLQRVYSSISQAVYAHRCNHEKTKLTQRKHDKLIMDIEKIASSLM